MRWVSSATLAFLTGCAPGAADGPADGEPVPDASAARAVLETELQRAEAAARQGRGEQAAAALTRAYRQGFEPLEPRIRDADPLALTALEYRFGEAIRTARHRPRGAVASRTSAVRASMVATAPETPASAAPATPSPASR